MWFQELPLKTLKSFNHWQRGGFVLKKLSVLKKSEDPWMRARPVLFFYEGMSCRLNRIFTFPFTEIDFWWNQMILRKEILSPMRKSSIQSPPPPPSPPVPNDNQSIVLINVQCDSRWWHQITQNYTGWICRSSGSPGLNWNVGGRVSSGWHTY